MAREIFEVVHNEFRAAVAEFVDRAVIPRLPEMAEARAHPRDLWLEAGSHGFLGFAIPAEYGGGGTSDYRFTVVLLEELARASAATPSAFGIHLAAAPYLLSLTSDLQKERWLPGYCTGDLVAAVALTEPSGGSDLAALKTSATKDGDDWIINGSKTFITNGGNADIYISAVRTTPGSRSRGISLIVVEPDTPGFSRGQPLEKIGQHEADTAELFFHDARVTGHNLIGEQDGGFAHLMANLADERIGAAVTNIAHARWILVMTLDYVKQRYAFGRPIGTFQANAFSLAEAVTQADVTQAYVDRLVMEHNRGELSPVDAAKAKWWTADVQGRILDLCVQMHGGYGFMREYGAARAWADARITRIWAGSNEIMKLIIARDLGLAE